MTRRFAALFCAAGLALAALAGCQGQFSGKPPVHPNWNMDNVARYDMQEPSSFFADGRAMRPPVEGTVPRGFLKDDDAYWEGKDGERFIERLPDGIELTLALLERGRDRYAIYCTPCHDATGSGRGVVIARGMLPPPSFTDPRLLQQDVGYFYNVITHGVRNMPAYAAQIPVADRWAIAAYVRALQRSASATIDEVPDDIKDQRGWTP
ncbi:cytochrome c [bacterium]|nr:cytochrome c [bacterium]